MSYQEAAVAHINDLNDGEMKQVSVGDTDILLSKVNGNFYAVHGHCTHYGAPLAKGALHGNRVTCPWHHACFDVTTGQHLDPPGMDSLPQYEVYIQGDQVYVRLPEEAAESETPRLSKQQNTDRTIVIVGGGTAGVYAAQALRMEGFTGKIIMITQEDDLPYDRPNCSKDYLQDKAPAEWMPLRDESFYQDHDIEVWRQKVVDRLDARQKTISFKDGSTLSFDTALICTGGKVKTLSVPGVTLKNVFTLRSLKDSSTIREVAKGIKKVVIVGSSFIGMESAWSLQKLGCEVTVVSPESIPFAKVWGERVGTLIRQLHEKNGVKFQMESKVEKIEGDTKAERVILDNGNALPAGLVLIGIGVEPATGFVEGVEQAKDGGIKVDAYLQAVPEVYAAGDVAQFPYDGHPVRIEHWRVACQQGRWAGKNMAGKEEPFEKVPFFWTAQQGVNIRYVGHVKDYDRIIYDGKVEEQKFIAYYIKDGAIKAALGINRDTEMAAIEALMLDKQLPSPDEVEASKMDWLAKLKE